MVVVEEGVAISAIAKTPTGTSSKISIIITIVGSFFIFGNGKHTFGWRCRCWLWSMATAAAITTLIAPIAAVGYTQVLLGLGLLSRTLLLMMPRGRRNLILLILTFVHCWMIHAGAEEELEEESHGLVRLLACVLLLSCLIIMPCYAIVVCDSAWQREKMVFNNLKPPFLTLPWYPDPP